MQIVTPSAVDVTVTLAIVDSGDGTPETGVTSATSGLALWYRKGATGAKVPFDGVGGNPSVSDLSALTDAHSDGGLLHISDGLYRFDLPDAAVPTSEHEVTTVGGTATGMVVLGTALVGKPAELGGTAQSGDAFARLGAPAGASIAADIAAVPTTVWAAGTRTLTSLTALAADIRAALQGYLYGGRSG